MMQQHMVNQVLNWERRLKIEDEKRENHRREPYVNYLAKVQPCRKEHRSIFRWLLSLNLHRNRQSAAYRGSSPKTCCETQIG